MDDKKYNSTIEFRDCSLHISLEYEYPITKKDVESNLDYYQWRFSQKFGLPVPREEIVVSCEGELQKEITNFRVEFGKRLYMGLMRVHQKAPYVLPILIKDLNEHRKECDLQDKETKLIQQTVEGLEEIITKSEETIVSS